MAGAAALLTLSLLASLMIATEAGSQTSAGVTSRQSLSSGDLQANGPSGTPAISADGRFVAFASAASNLVGTDADGDGTCEASEGCDTNDQFDVFVRDRDVDGDGLFDRPGDMTTVLVSVRTDETQGNGPSGEPSISADGRYVTFSTTSNLTGDPDEDGNGTVDVYIRDLVDGTTQLVSFGCTNTTAAGNSSNSAISPDGRFVAFQSSDTEVITLPPGDEFCSTDPDDLFDIYVRELATATTTKASLPASGGAANGDSTDPAISADGTVVVFESTAQLVPADTNDFSDIYIRAGGATSRVSITNTEGPANGPSRDPAISWDGLLVAFESGATNLFGASESTTFDDVFVRDRDPDRDGDFGEANASTTRVSVNNGGVIGNRGSANPSISADGRFVAFESLASNLVKEDTNSARDIFLRDREDARTTRESVDSEEDETSPRTVSELPALSADARHVSFQSDATTLVARLDTTGDGVCDFECEDTNLSVDVFVRDRQPLLVVEPAFVDFGEHIVQTTSPAETLVLANDGAGPLTIASVRLGGANSRHFLITSDECSGTTLQPSEPNDQCEVDVAFRPRSMDVKTAVLEIDSTAAFDPTALLIGFGHHPILEIDPSMVDLGFVTFVTGELFPPNSRIVLTWEPGLGVARIRSNGAGEIETPMLVFHRDITGPRLLHAEGPGVEAEVKLFVSSGSAQPPDFVNRG